VIDGGKIFGITSVALGGAAMVSALMVWYQIKRTQLDTKQIVIDLNYIKNI
jgi:hypothetical protein